MTRPRSDHEFDAWLRHHEPTPPPVSDTLQDQVRQLVETSAVPGHPHGPAITRSPVPVRRLAVPGLFWLAAAAALLLWWTANPHRSPTPLPASPLQTQVVASLLDDLELRLAGQRLAALEQRFEQEERQVAEANASPREEDPTPAVGPSLAVMEQRVTEVGLDESPAGLLRLVTLQTADPDILGRPYVARCARELARQYPDSFTSREALRFAATLDP